MTLKMSDEFQGRIKIEHDFLHFQCRSMSDPPLSDIDFKNKMALV